MRLVLAGGTLYTPEERLRDSYLVIESGKICALGQGDPPRAASRVLRLAAGWVVIPGLIDLHTHGYGGAGVEESPEELGFLQQKLASEGTTAFLATTPPLPLEKTRKILKTAAALRENHPPGAALLGVHLEGPFLNPGYAGCHPRENLLPPNREVLSSLLFPGSPVLLLTLAPELPGALDLIREAARRGVRVNLGHSGASFHEALAAFAAGAAGVTPLVNQMAPLHHRAPGLVGAALSTGDAYVELIPDGVHVHPEVVKLVLRLKGRKVVFVSDSLPCSGLPPGSYTCFGRQFRSTPEGVLTPAGRLAGSFLSLLRALRALQRATGLPLEEVLPPATANPAAFLGLEGRKGRIAPGCDADVVVCDENLKPLLTLVKGEVVFRAPDAAREQDPPL